MIGALRVLVFVGIATLTFASFHSISAQSVIGKIQSEIETHNTEIAKLEAEIATYQKELDTIGAKRSTLESEVRSLALARQKLSANIGVTQNKIASANLKLEELSLAIGDKEEAVTLNRNTIARSLRDLDAADDRTLVEQLAASTRLADAWTAIDASASVERALGDRIGELETIKTALSANRDEVATTKKKLVSLSVDLGNQRRAVDATKKAQETLLSQTKNQESSYQKLIIEKQAARRAFEEELARLQGELQIAIDPSRIPSVGSGVLSWPFSDAFMRSCTSRKSVFGNLFCVTQYFGNTAFATKNPQIYNGKGHNGIDIGTSIGTPVETALSGVIRGTGNTDAIRGCYSYGKWVLVEHINGLSTLYAHLSDIQVREGETIVTGDVVGYSGNTGYSTGPHLHFTVFATQGVRVQRLSDFRGAVTPCANAIIPVAPKEAYLNPLSYL